MISIIAVIGQNNELGCDNKLLWHLPVDMARFKRITSGHPIIMGRNTFESIGKPLPNRTNIVITRNPNYKAEGVLVFNTVNDALKEAQKQPGGDEIFIIGGAQIYQEAIHIADKLYLTIIEDNPMADVFFPNYKEFATILKEEKGIDNGFWYQYKELTK